MYTKDWNAGRKTYSKTNQFHFVCPIFSARVALRSCIQLRDQFWVYGKPYEKRRGCQACMASSKCPALAVVNDILNRGGDPYSSDNPDHTGVLDDSIYRRINRVIVMDHHLMKYDVPEPELSLIRAANEKARNGVDLKSGRKGIAAPLGVIENTNFKRAEPINNTRIESAKTVSVNDTVHAASSGDMSAAINAMMENEK